MENSAYAATSAHLNSPALVVFSQAASGLQDVLRIQRPFNHQMSLSEASKELHQQQQQQQRFNAASAAFSLRHMEAAYGALPSHILSHLQPQFLHPCLSLGSGAGAFRPLTDFKQLPPPSAFAPPKCLKIETNADSMHSMQQHSGGGTGGSIFSPAEDRLLGPSPRTDSCSPGSASLSPQSQTAVKEESLDAQLSEDGGEGGGYRQGDGEAGSGGGSPTPTTQEQEHHRGFRCE
ncbi:unnamed protein product [Acanthoscelides obtectus]|uniref:Uncharacterized protein n=1 Tax=Acanthoscelides obtectus TaxID=200917 RepID=A0A9P0KDL6_ACAOB|nr:unnamed protein product [Acanthoscelides obtectus]CAK1629387.1 hypothetical protein AOBTE_LOCUS5713 [Acanthoscelides obtectus]